MKKLYVYYNCKLEIKGYIYELKNETIAHINIGNSEEEIERLIINSINEDIFLIDDITVVKNLDVEVLI